MENDIEMWRINVESDFEWCVFCYMWIVMYLGVYKCVLNFCLYLIEWYLMMLCMVKIRYIVINLM